MLIYTYIHTYFYYMVFCSNCVYISLGFTVHIGEHGIQESCILNCIMSILQ